MSLSLVTFPWLLGAPTVADRPAIGSYPYTVVPGTFFFPSDATQAYVSVWVAPGVLGWVPFNPTGGGGGGVVSVTAVPNQGIAIAGLPATPTVAVQTPAQASGDLLYRNNTASWVSLPPGADGTVPTADTIGPDRVLFYRAFGSTTPIQYSYAGGHQFDFGFPGTQAQGDTITAAGAYPAAWLRVPIGNLYDQYQVQSGVVAWVPSGAVENYDLYVAGTSGNDANDGLSALTPVATLNRAMQLVPATVKGNVLIHCAPNEPITETVVWNWQLPSGKAPEARAITIDAPLTEVLAAQVIGGGTQGLLYAFGAVTGLGPLVPGLYDGLLLEYLTPGPNQGIYRISNNGAASISICGSFPAGPVPGDQVRVLEESVVVTLAAAGSSYHYFYQGQVIFSGVELQQNASGLVVNKTQVLLNCASLRDSTGSVICVQGGAMTGGTGFSRPYPSGLAAPIAPTCGPELFATMQALQNSGLYFANAKQRAPALCDQNSTGQFDGIDLVDSGSIGFRNNSSGLVGSIRCGVTVATGPGIIYAENNSSIQVSFVDFNYLSQTTAAVEGLSVSKNSVCYAAGLATTSIPLAGNWGVYCFSGSRCEVVDAGVGSNISGAVGDVQVGGNAAPSTWAQIAGFTAAFCQDLAAAFPTQATVIP